MKKTYLYILLITTILFSSCEGFLKEECYTSITVDWVYNTLDGFESGAVSLYNKMRDVHHGESETRFGVVSAMHDLTGPRVLTGAIKFDSRYLTPASFGDGKDIVNGLNFVIDRANALLSYEDKFNYEINSNEYKRLKVAAAEIRFFRSLAFYTLYRQYHNIYLTTEPTNPNNFIREYHVADPKDVFELIVSDMKIACADLPWTNEHGRLNGAAATHLLAKVYLWMGWDSEARLDGLTEVEAFKESLRLSETLIEDTNYKLVDIKSVFGTVDHPDRDIKEQYFAYKHSFSHPGNLGGSVHLLGCATFPRYWELKGMKIDPVLNQTMGWTSVNAYLMSRYGKTEEDRMKDLRYSTYYMQKFYYNDPDNLPDGVRLGDEVKFEDQELTAENYYRRMAPGLMKFLDLKNNSEDNHQYSDVIVYRKAETYLIAAEAAFKLGDKTKSIGYINCVRRRAYGKDINMPNSECDFSEDQLTIDLLLDENARELAFEGQRFYMLKRTGKFYEYMKDHSGQSSKYQATYGIRGFDVYNTSRLQVQPYMVNFPYHQDIMDMLGNPDFQNPGYN